MKKSHTETDAAERARASGLDISLLESSLRLTPTERLIRNEGLLALAREFARSRAERHATHRSAPQATARRGGAGRGG